MGAKNVKISRWEHSMWTLYFPTAYVRIIKRNGKIADINVDLNA